MEIFGVDDMIDEHVSNEEFKKFFYSSIVLSLMEIFGVDNMIQEHVSNE
jgi:hypothetical protein